jgi:DNA-binding transcriptional MerR regulator
LFKGVYRLDNSSKRGIFVNPLYLYKKMANPLADDFYRIGSVAALTGIAVERLRAWERRHDFSPAHKHGRTRFYSAQQLEKLKKIKHLIDRGQTVSSVIHLSEQQLNQRLSESSARAVDSPKAAALTTPLVGLVGANLLHLEQRQEPTDRIDVVARWANLDALLDPSQQQQLPQVLVLQMPVLSTQDIAKAQQHLPDSKIITAYQFATAAELSRCQTTDTPVLKWPLDWREIEFTCLEESKKYIKSAGYAQRRFSDEELIALAVSDTDPNQPTQHLVEAVHQINALSAYLQTCAEEHGSGAIAHGPLDEACSDAAYARAYLESALHTITATAENPPPQQAPNRPPSGPSGLAH